MSPPPSRTRRRAPGRPPGALIAALIAVLVGAGALLAWQGSYSDRIYPGINVDGVDIGGMTPDAARAALEQGLAHYAQGTATVSAGGRTIQISYAAAGRHADLPAILARAWAIGRGGGLDGVTALVGHTTITPVIAIDQVALTAAVEDAARSVDTGTLDAKISATKTGFAASGAQLGQGLDRSAVTAAVAAALTDPSTGSTTSLTSSLTAVPPQVTDEEAAAAVSAANAMARDVVLTFGGANWRISAASVRTWITFPSDAKGGLSPLVSTAAVTKALKTLSPKVDLAAKDAGFTMNGTVVTGVTASHQGRALDVAASTLPVAAAVTARGQPGAPAKPPAVPLTVATTEPGLTTAEARKAAPRMRRISTWTTFYESSSHNGFGSNITIPAHDINGKVVAPGAVFDFWKSIGPVTYARGYRDGGAIINGHSQPTGALAGGICSTSTTLFNAVMRAGYETLDKRNHYYYITRFPVGLDATVVISGTSIQTMSWRNDTQYPVLIRSAAGGGAITFSLYSVPAIGRPAVSGGSPAPGATNTTYKTAIGRTVSITTSAKQDYSKATSSVEFVNTLPAGKSKVIEYPTDGFNVTVTRTVTQNGTVIHHDVWISHYARVNGLTQIGKSNAKPSPSPLPSASPAR